MKNADMPAMPQSFSIGDEDCGTTLTHLHVDDLQMNMGLTKREMFAMHIMASTCWDTTDRNNQMHYEYAASSAVKLADALLKELDK